MSGRIRRSSLLGSVLAATLAFPTAALAAPGPDPEPNPTADTSAPVITVSRPDGVEGWHPDTVQVVVDVTDIGTNGGSPSGLLGTEYAITGAHEETGVFGGATTFTFSAQGSSRLEINAQDRAGNLNQAVHWVGIDRTAPWVNIAAPLSPGAEFPLGAVATVGFSCGDAHSGLAECSGNVANGSALYTARPGEYTVAVQATDKVGRTHVERVTYRVLPASLEIRTPPRITGTARVGQLLSATDAEFSPEPTTVEHAWLRDGTPIPGADQPSYPVTAADAGRDLSYRATARRDDHVDAVATAEAVRVEGRLVAAGRPTVRGSARVGGTLTAAAPSFGVPAATAFQWLRDGRPIPGATAPTLRVVPADAGRRLAARVTGSRSGYEPLAVTSTVTGPVARAVPTVRAKGRARGQGRVRLVVKVRAAGVPVAALRGRAVVRVGKRVVGRVAVLRGRAVLQLRHQPRKRVRYTVLYRGTAVVAPRTVTARVRVR